MPRYRIYAAVHGTKCLGEYEAATEDEAIGMAVQENGHVSLCHHCGHELSDPEIGDCTAELVDDKPERKRGTR